LVRAAGNALIRDSKAMFDGAKIAIAPNVSGVFQYEI